MNVEIFDKIENKSDIIHIPKECLKYNTLREDIENYIKSVVYDDWSDKKLYPEDETFQKFFIEIDKKELFKKKLKHDYYGTGITNLDYLYETNDIGKLSEIGNLGIIEDYLEIINYNDDTIEDMLNDHASDYNYEITKFLIDVMIWKNDCVLNFREMLRFPIYENEIPTQNDLENIIKILKYTFENSDKINFKHTSELFSIKYREILDLLYEYKDKLNVNIEHIEEDMYKITALK